MSNYFESVEMFGQYEGNGCVPDPSRHVKISSFGEILTSFQSIRRPIKVTIVGDNGRSYDWIVKYGEDLRQDQRIQQVSQILPTLILFTTAL
jgi:DNA-dependent protein kinase catalytic subunit